MSGWYWLQRRRDGAMRLGCYARVTWRIADEIGRTRVYGSDQMTRLFEVVSAVEEPRP
jgi:hypothetical protein